MSDYQKCVHVTDMHRVAYWKKHEAIEIYPLAEGLFMVNPGEYAVWMADGEGPLMEVMNEESFSNRFVTEENLPERFVGVLKEAPTYAEWVKWTHRLSGREKQ